MGGDKAPEEIIAGAWEAIENIDATILLVGPKNTIKKNLTALGADVTAASDVTRNGPGSIRVVDAPDVIGMSDEPTKAVRSMPKSSISVAAKLVKDGKADGVVSAGNTGAMVAAGLLIIGRIKGIPRPAIGVPIPTKSSPAFLIDAGANSDCRPEHLLHFGNLGSVYSREILGIDKPRVGVLSIGQEKGKGNDLAQKAAELLENSNLAFIGNVEGRDIPSGDVDVVVTDGFTGNITLKTLEGAAEMIVAALKDELMANTISKLLALGLKKRLKAFKQRMDPESYGGAHLLGVNGICVITHGSSSRTAIVHSLNVACQAVDRELIKKVKLGLTALKDVDIEEATPTPISLDEKDVAER